MRCPSCDAENLEGQDRCANCGSDLRSIDVPLPHDEISTLLLERHITEIATPNPITATPDESIVVALEKMRRHNIRALVIVDGAAIVGIITERDIVLKLPPDESGEHIAIRELMTPDPVVANAGDPIGKAMERLVIDRVHHLPVVEDGKLVGIVSMRDLLHALAPALVGSRNP